MKKGGAVSKYASGGIVNNINDSSQKKPLPKPTGKIATMKKGGPVKGGLTIVIATPMKKSVGRGR